MSMNKTNGNAQLVSSGIVKTFGGLIAVNKVDLELAEGEIAGLIGPNGAGKSTLFNVLSGSMRCDSGTISVLGIDSTKLAAHEVCKIGVARTYQIVRPLKKMTVLENVMVGAFIRTNSVKEARTRAQKIIGQAELEPFMNVQAGSLTLANRKKVELARALATQPKILLLDEVMAGLNPAELQRFCSFLRSINATGITLLIVEHVMEAVMNLCSHLMVMNYGVKIADGIPMEVIHDPQVISAYLGEESL